MASERRSYPRYPVQCPIAVTLPEDASGAVYNASANNISRTSIQIECGAELITALLRQQKLPYMCQLKFLLPWYSSHTFIIDASVVTHRRLSTPIALAAASKTGSGSTKPGGNWAAALSAIRRKKMHSRCIMILLADIAAF